MSAAVKILTEARSSTEHPASKADVRMEAGLKHLLRVANAPDDHPERSSSIPQADWGPLIERLRNAGRHSRAVEAQAHEQDARVRQLLDRVREDIREADERAHAAEVRVRDIQAQATAQVLIAEERTAAASARADAAEARARSAEQWLAQVQETILAEFSNLPS